MGLCLALKYCFCPHHENEFMPKSEFYSIKWKTDRTPAKDAPQSEPIPSKSMLMQGTTVY